MVVTREPDHGLQEAQRLQCFAEGPCGLGRNAIQHVRHFVHTQPACLGRIARHEHQDRVDGFDSRLRELDGLLVTRSQGSRPGPLGHATARQQALLEDHAPVSADVVDHTALVEGTSRRQGREVLRRVDGRDTREGPREDDALVRLDDDPLRLAHPPRQSGPAHGPREPLAVALGDEVRGGSLAIAREVTLARARPQPGQPLVHASSRSFMPLAPRSPSA